MITVADARHFFVTCLGLLWMMMATLSQRFSSPTSHNIDWLAKLITMLSKVDLGDAAANMALKLMPQNLRQILEIEARNQGCNDPLLLEKVTPGADQAFTLFLSIQSRILAGGDGSQLESANVSRLFGIE